MRFYGAASALVLAVMTVTSAQAADPTPDNIALARQMMANTEGDRASTIQGLAAPMVGMMQQMGVRDPAQAQALVNEALLPMLNEHYDELVAMQAKSYATQLSADDMKAAIEFYKTPAGKDLIAAQPKLAQAKVVDMTAWIQKLQPEMVGKVQATMAAHGWK